MENGHDDLGGRTPFLRVHVHGYATAIITDGDGLVGVNGDLHALAIAGQGFINGIIHNLEHHVVQAGAIIRVANVHSRPFSHGIKAF